MGIKQEDIDRAIREGNKVLAKLAELCPAPDPKSSEALEFARITLPTKKRIRQRSKPLSNKLEREFGAHLQRLWPNWAAFEQAITFRLANGVRYTPDWVMMEPGNVYCYEVKGPRMWDDAVVKLKVAATTYRHCQWFMAWKENGFWQTQAVEP